jgi:hypothetical protein
MFRFVMFYYDSLRKLADDFDETATDKKVLGYKSLKIQNGEVAEWLMAPVLKIGLN